MSLAYRMGLRAAVEGRADTDCPFPERTRYAREWLQGYRSAR